MVESRLHDRQQPVRGRAALAHGFEAGVGLPMLRRRTGLGAQPWRRLGDLLMPSDDPHLCQPVEWHGAEFRDNPGRCGPIKAINRLATAALVIGAIISQCVGDGVGTVVRHETDGCFARLALEPRARPLLRMCEAVNAETVRIARIISGAKRFKMAFAVRIAELGNPGPALRAAAIAERASGRQNRPIRLAAFGELHPSGPGVDLPIAYGAGHRGAPFSPSQNVRQLYGTDVGGQWWIEADSVFVISWVYGAHTRPAMSQKCRFSPLSRRQHRFESGR